MANKRITDVDTVELKSNELFFINQNNTIKQVPKADVIESVVNSFSDESIATDVKSKLGLGLVASKDVVPIANGGTGASNPAAARNALGLDFIDEEKVVPIENGGTGTTNIDEALLNLLSHGIVLSEGIHYGDSTNDFTGDLTDGAIFFC